MVQPTGQMVQKQLAEDVRYYYNLQQEKVRIEMSMEIAKKAIMANLTATGERDFFDAERNIKASIETRAQIRISPKEAEALLPPDLYQKLAKETVSVVLTIRKLKEKGDA